MQVNSITELSTLTRVPVKILTDLCTKLNLCIGNALFEAVSANEQVAIINIGIGVLSIELSSMQCKFVPSKELKTTIKKSLKDGVDPVAFELENALIQKLLATYKAEL